MLCPPPPLRVVVRSTIVALFALTAAAGAASAALSLYMSPERLASRAPLIVEARVGEVRSGYDPDSGRLATYVPLLIDEVWRGPAELTHVVLREPGGRWGELVHEIDAVPRYVAGERVLAFLEPGPDGALRTAGMFFGLFRLDRADGHPALARRDLDGRGLTLGAPSEPHERFELDALRRVVRRKRHARSTARWNASPPEHGRLLWDDRVHPREPLQKFAALGGPQPTRWSAVDLDAPVEIHVRPDGNPLGSNAAALAQIERGLAAWNGVGESRVRLQLGDPDFPYVDLYSTSPAAAYSGVNIVLFDDPYGDIADPEGCSGVLAVGGYWRAGGTGSTVNGIAFHTALQMYVVFNNDFECFLGDPDNLAEIAAHELGHGLGFGHSPAPDSIMRAAAYGGRGPRLGDDDRDAAHCHYPHAVTITAPVGEGGEPLPGQPLAVRWSTTAGADAPPIDLHYSLDGGAGWTAIALGVADDGELDWVVPPDASGSLRVRISRARLGAEAPAGYPSRCTVALSDTFALDTPRTADDVGATRATAERINSRRPSPPARHTAIGGGRAPSSTRGSRAR